MAQIPAGQVIEAALALMLAGRWSLAEQLLAAAAPAAPAEQAALALARAEVAADGDFWCRTCGGPAAAERAARAITAAGTEPELRFDLDLLQLRLEYSAELFGPAACRGSARPAVTRPP